MKKFKYGKYIITVNDCDNMSDKEIKKRILKEICKLHDSEDDTLKYQLFVKLAEKTNEDDNFYGKFDTVEHAVEAAKKDIAVLSYKVCDLDNNVVISGKNEKAPVNDSSKRVFEVLWYDSENSRNDPSTQEFKSKREALNFYNKHKNDEDKFDWWVTERDADTWEIIKDIIY